MGDFVSSIRKLFFRIFKVLRRLPQRKGLRPPILENSSSMTVINEVGTENKDFGLKADDSTTAKRQKSSITNDDHNSSTFLELPQNFRDKIYANLDPVSVLSLSQAGCKELRNEIGKVRGLHIRVQQDGHTHSDNDNGHTELSKLEMGMESLTLDNCGKVELPKVIQPDFLRELTVIGACDPSTVNKVLASYSSIEVLRLGNVKMDLESKECCLLHQIFCPAITEVEISTHSQFPALLPFIYLHSKTLKSLTINLVSTSSGPLKDLQMSPRERNKKTVQQFPQLQKFHFVTDKIEGEWKDLLLSCSEVRDILLEPRKGLAWDDLWSRIVSKGVHLQNIKVINLTAKIDPWLWPLDLNVLRYCVNLKTLRLDHKVQEEFIPRITNSFAIPKGVKEIGFGHFVLRPQQELTLLLKYNSLETLELQYWTESEKSLSSFLNTLAFLLKFNLIRIKRFQLTELTSTIKKMEKEMQRLQENKALQISLQEKEKGELEIVIINQEIMV